MSEQPANSPESWCLECAGLSIRRSGRLVVKAVSLTLRRGECVSLVGPNGSGKTTLMLGLLGLLPRTDGTVRLDGRDTRRFSARHRGRFAAYVPQTIESVPAFRVYDVVAGGRFPHLGPLRPLSVEDHAGVQSALRRCGLTELADRPFDAVSGGERQKTLIAAAIAQDPELMFLDEPNTALDPAYQLELVRILRSWHRSGGGLLVISHDLQLPGALGGRVIAMQEGRIVADGPAVEVLNPETLAQIYAARFAAVTTPTGSRVVLPEWWLGD